ncbi:hypothetical protein JCM14076_08800 [Methylosoma difficile]
MYTDVETARDLFAAKLDGVGFYGTEVDNALFRGCNLISAAEMKANEGLKPLAYMDDLGFVLAPLGLPLPDKSNDGVVDWEGSRFG